MTRGARAACLAVGLSCGCGAVPAHAERAVVSLSNDEVAIGSSYTGGRVTVFAAIERDGQSVARPGGYGAIVTIRGPREAITVRRKEALGPIWLNRAQQKFAATPSLLQILSSAPLGDLVDVDLRRRLRLGVDAVVYAPEVTLERGGDDDPFRAALIRLKARDGLFAENDHGVVFVTPDILRATVALPALAPLGRYDVEVSILAGGVVVTREDAHFVLVKTGFEDDVASLARDRAMLYGLATAALSLLFGWLASVVFRRD